MPSDRQAEIQARVERAGAFADGDIEWLLAELSRVQQACEALTRQRDEAVEAQCLMSESRSQQEIATLRNQVDYLCKELEECRKARQQGNELHPH